MTRRSKFSRMVRPHRMKLDAMLAEGATIDETHREAESLGEDVSRSTVARRAKRFAEEARQMRELQQMTQAIRTQMQAEGLKPEDSTRVLAGMLTARLQMHLLDAEAFPLDMEAFGGMARALRTIGLTLRDNPAAPVAEDAAEASPAVRQMMALIQEMDRQVDGEAHT